MMNNQNIQQALPKFSSKTILVIGDLMLDAYVWGDALRISPEAPVPVVQVSSQDYMPGGAANVARNVSGLGAQVYVGGLVGVDQEGNQLMQLLEESGIHSDIIIQTNSRPTSVKTRIIARNQHVVRYDRETTRPVDPSIQSQVFDQIMSVITSVDGIILEDYDKGFFSVEFITQVLEKAESNGIPVYVDPKKQFFDAYKGIRLLKPNWSEFSHAVGPFASEEAFLSKGEAYRKAQHIDTLIVTRGAEGMTLFNQTGTQTIPTHARRVHDVSGAGDTVIATYTLADVSGLSDVDAAALANLAAGIVCEEVGVVPITTRKLQTRLSELISAQH